MLPHCTQLLKKRGLLSEPFTDCYSLKEVTPIIRGKHHGAWERGG